jgi:hypothetical protein
MLNAIPYIKNQTHAFFFAVIILTASLVSSAQDAQKVRINFKRMNKAGDFYHASIRAEYSVFCEITGKSGIKEIRKNKSLEMDGNLTILESDANGSPTSLRFSSEKISAKSGDASELFSKGYGNFKLDWQDGKMVLTLDGENLTPRPEEIELLALVFRPPSSATLDGLIGTQEELSVGDKWFAPKDLLKEIFLKKGIKLEDGDISNVSSLREKNKTDSGDCWVIENNVAVSGVPDFNFNYKAEIFLPCDNLTIPLKTMTKSSETIKRKKVDDGSLLSDDIEGMVIKIDYSMNVELTAK